MSEPVSDAGAESLGDAESHFTTEAQGERGGPGRYVNVDDLTPESINTTANLTMEKLDAGWTITTIQLDVTARVPGASQEAFNKAAENAKSGCPVSKVLNAKITMNAKLES